MHGGNSSEFGANVTVVAPIPLMLLGASVSPSGTQLPGTELTFTSTYTNAGTAAATSVVITDPIPANTDFKVGSATQALGSTGLSVVIAYSSDGGTSWSYSPASGAGGAPAALRSTRDACAVDVHRQPEPNGAQQHRLDGVRAPYPLTVVRIAVVRSVAPDSPLSPSSLRDTHARCETVRRASSGMTGWPQVRVS